MTLLFRVIGVVSMQEGEKFVPTATSSRPKQIVVLDITEQHCEATIIVVNPNKACARAAQRSLLCVT